MNNEMIEKMIERYGKTGKAEFLFNIKTGEVVHKSMHSNKTQDWRWITDEYYPVYIGEEFDSWMPHGFEDREFLLELESSTCILGAL